MEKALQSLPWVRKATVDFKKQQVTLVVEKGKYKEAEAFAALKNAGFDGKPSESPESASTFPQTSFRVGGMKKTKSGVT